MKNTNFFAFWPEIGANLRIMPEMVKMRQKYPASALAGIYWSSFEIRTQFKFSEKFKNQAGSSFS